MMKNMFIAKRDFLRLVVGLLVCFQATMVMAQSQITIKYHLMFADVSVFNSGLCLTSQAMIDTGSSVCVIDSTYAVDSCQIKGERVNATVGNTMGKDINTSYVYVDSIAFGGVIYTNVRCYLVDLVGKLQQFASKFVIGGEILKRDLWCYDLKRYTLQRYAATPDKVVATLKWKRYADAALNHIYFEGKIGGKKTRILFDTGSVRNAVTSSFDITPTEKIKVQSANFAEKLSHKEVGLCKNIPVELSKYNFNLDFIKVKGDGSKYPRINADFLQGKKWVLDYKRRRLLILDSE
ncbi:MAG: aspartyl protease family protein [Prevotella shahii]|uniref:pepsin/retropepsin-like aspartic protease family protein n=1 Tax=Hoylesella shahii TaxID=228603 RepID=UPI001CAC98BE|nr:pepsin/retropepsin-like aspartic protease family protein [Hoylesella shahii]MBF1590705.1 aspartyl protease family protein [Hoylesella shahii]